MNARFVHYENNQNDKKPMTLIKVTYCSYEGFPQDGIGMLTRELDKFLSLSR